MINKKNIIQKGFRLDSRISKNLDILANITGRSQNELATLAFQDFFIENSIYFIEDQIIEALNDSSRFALEVAGLGFYYDEGIIMFYSLNRNNQEVNELCECISTMYNLSDEGLQSLEVQKTRMEDKGYILFETLGVDKNDEEFYNDLHRILTKIDTDFLEMQEWINNEFDYS